MFFPIYVFGADHCTNPDEYTVDKRCYVTKEQKQTKPYNAVVALVKHDPFRIYCTGTIVKKNDTLYLYTAKHCVVDNDNVVSNQINIRTQDLKEYVALNTNSGSYYRTATVDDNNNSKTVSHNKFGDWAVYKITDDLAAVDITDAVKVSMFGNSLDYDARLIGHGELKIMSDKEILDFKQKYLDYLINTKNVDVNEPVKKYGIVNETVQTINSNVSDFILNYLKQSENEYYMKTFIDRRNLKESKCVYTSLGEIKKCQAWGGNSGGGIFDKDGNLMAIHTTGRKQIGGNNHAEAVDSINLEKKPDKSTDTDKIINLVN